MAKPVPRTGLEDEEDEETVPKTWDDMDAEELEKGLQKTPPRQEQATEDGGDEQTVATASSGQGKKQKEGRPQLLVSTETIE